MQEKIYFTNLNGIRAISALMVIYSHVEMIKSYFKLDNKFQNIKHFGELGVMFFFVLSGFLITFLLLKEKEKMGGISYKNFYYRRILRIWPLYYLIVFLSLFVLPNFELFRTVTFNLDIVDNSKLITIIILFVLLLPNLLINIYLVPFSTQTWSIGTEEQFYFVWPWVINKIKKMFSFLIIIIITYNLILFIFEFIRVENIKYGKLIYYFFSTLKLDCLAIGSLGALLLYKNNYILKIFKNLIVMIIALIILIILIYSNTKFLFLNSTLYSLLFLIVLISLVYNKKLSQIIEFKIINYLGKISYGLYMYHQIVIVAVVNILLDFGYNESWIIYLLSILFTVILSMLSFEYFEKPFLNLKNKYSIFKQ